MHNMHTFSVYNSNFNIMELFDKMKKGFLLIAVCFICIGQIVAQNVAKIGTNEYSSLQAAVNDAYDNMTGDVTIEMTSDITAYTIIKQKVGLNLTIEGNDHTLGGQIIIDGNGGEQSNTETLILSGINFEGDGTSPNFFDKCFVYVPVVKNDNTKPYYHPGINNYAHNITISNCNFKSTSTESPDDGLIGYYSTSGGSATYNLTMSNVTGENLHSLAQLNASTGGSFDNCEITGSESFINISGGAGEYNVSNCTFTSALTTGYAVRLKSASSAEITLTNNTFEAADVLTLGKGSGNDVTGHINVESGTYKGALSNNQSTAATGSFVLTGGTFNEDVATVQSYCATDYYAVDNDPSADYCTVHKLVVAMIGTTEYSSLQAAVNDARDNMTGDVTINLVKNTTEKVTFRQKEGLNLTIDGGRDTLTGQIVVHGDGRNTGTDVLNITNLVFKYTSSYASPAGFVCVNGANNNAHNITVSNCLFIGDGPADGMAGYRGPNGAPAFNIVIDRCEARNMHSLALFYGTTNATVTNCKAVDNVKNGVSISGGKGTFTIINDTLTCNTDGEYALRVQNQSNATTTNISGDNVFTAPKAIITKENSNSSVALNVSSGRYNGIVSSEGTDNTVYSITGGTFNEDVTDKCATGYAAFDDHNDAPHTWTVYPAATVHFEPNGATGTMNDTIVKRYEPYVIPACAFTPASGYNFTGWKDNLGNDYNAGDPITLTSDTTFVAQWALATTITYHSNFGTDATLIQIKLADVDVTLYDATAFERIGHNLVKWNTAANGSGNDYALGAPYSDNEVLVLYAIWELKPCPNSNSVTDYDGNTYATVRIGTQYRCWTTSNLSSTHYSSGDEIPNVKHYPLNTRASVHGNLYDYNAAMDADHHSSSEIETALSSNTPYQGICPTGYHIPTETEVNELLGAFEPAQMMSPGWTPDNGTNTSGLTITPSGFYNSELDRYERMYASAYFWILTPPTAVYHACEFGAACSSMELIPGILTNGYSVRCVADE